MSETTYADKDIKVTTLAPEGKADVLSRIIEQLSQRFTDGTTGGSAKRLEPSAEGPMLPKLHDLIRRRRLHYHNDPRVDTDLPEPYHEGHKFQTDRLRQVANQLVSRLTENKAVAVAEEIKDTAGQRQDANDLSTVLNAILQFTYERTGLDIQETLARDLVTKCYGVLHWRMAAHMWPEIPEPEELDELPEGADKNKYLDRRSSYKRRGVKRYRERAEAHEERVKQSRARAGSPWIIECLQPDQVMYWEDRSLENGFGMMVVLREVGVLDYARELHKKDGIAVRSKHEISINQANPDVPMYLERDAPAEWEPSGYLWGERVQIAEVWTRNEYYELCDFSGQGGWELVKSCPTPYEMPPFVLAPAVENNETDPALRWEPALEGMYRQKPTVDRAISLFLTLGESVALPWYYLKKVEGGGPMLDDKGKIVQFTRNSAAAMQVPDGYEIAELTFDINPAFIEGIKYINEEFAKTAPATGQAEISTSTQPWTARIEQAQQNVEPKALLNNISHAMQVMLRNMALVMSKPEDEYGFGEPVWMFAHTKDGKTDSSTVVGVEPEKIRTLDIRVDIEATSSAERITLQEHGRALRADPLVGLTWEEFVENYEGKPNADEVVAKRRVAQAYDGLVYPGLIKQKIAERLGPKIVFEAGKFIGPNGQEMASQDAVAANGFNVRPMQPSPGGVATQTQMPQQPQLQAPGAIPLPAQVAG